MKPLKKGSPEAKAYMAKLRAMQGKKRAGYPPPAGYCRMCGMRLRPGETRGVCPFCVREGAYQNSGRGKAARANSHHFKAKDLGQPETCEECGWKTGECPRCGRYKRAGGRPDVCGHCGLYIGDLRAHDREMHPGQGLDIGKARTNPRRRHVREGYGRVQRESGPPKSLRELMKRDPRNRAELERQIRHMYGDPHDTAADVYREAWLSSHPNWRGKARTNPMKFLTAADRKALPPLYSQEKKGDQAIAYVKFFTPDSNWTWYATEFDGKDQFFGLVQGFEEELGYFSLSELQSARGPRGLHIERDLHFRPTPLAQLRKTANPLTRREAGRLLRSARRDYRKGVSYPHGGYNRSFLLGEASGRAASVIDHGPRDARRAARRIEMEAFNAYPNPPAYYVIDPQSGTILSIQRATKSMHEAFNRAVDDARTESSQIEREVILVVHPYIPHGWKVGTRVTPLFWSYGAQVMYPDGKMGPYNNPCGGRGNPRFRARYLSPEMEVRTGMVRAHGTKSALRKAEQRAAKLPPKFTAPGSAVEVYRANPLVQIPGDLNAVLVAITRLPRAVNWSALPYAQALLSGDTGCDDPKGVLLYLKSNLRNWKGTEARVGKQIIDKYAKTGLAGFNPGRRGLANPRPKQGRLGNPGDKYVVAKDKFVLWYHSDTRNLIGDPKFVPKGTVLLHEGDSETGNVWFVDPSGSRGKTDAGSIDNLVRSGAVRRAKANPLLDWEADHIDRRGKEAFAKAESYAKRGWPISAAYHHGEGGALRGVATSWRKGMRNPGLAPVVAVPVPLEAGNIAKWLRAEGVPAQVDPYRGQWGVMVPRAKMAQAKRALGKVLANPSRRGLLGEARASLALAKGDVKAGHAGAAQYWKGRAAGLSQAALSNAGGSWIVLRDGKKISPAFKKDSDAYAWLHRRQGQSVAWAVQHEGYDIVLVRGGKTIWSAARTAREFPRKNPLLQMVALANPGKMTCPFREGQKVSIAQARAWAQRTGNRSLLQQIDQVCALQKKANRSGSYFVWKTIPIGDPKRIEMVTAVAQYGTTDETLYHPPKGSRKGSHLYSHRWNEGSKKKTPVPLLAAASGKALLMPLDGSKRVSDWLRG